MFQFSCLAVIVGVATSRPSAGAATPASSSEFTQLLAPPPYDENVGRMLLGFQKAVSCNSASGFRPRNTGARRYITGKTVGGAAGVGVMNQGGCFVAFEGTHTDKQKWLDADFAPTPFRSKTCDGCTVDNGFFVNYMTLSPAILEALATFGCKKEKLYISGHSLGAAAVHYMLWDALEVGYNVSHALALETPRPGNKKFAEALQKQAQGVNAWRTTHYHDVVPQVPPDRIMDYSHAFYEIFYDQEHGDHYRVCNAFEDITCSLQFQLQPWLWSDSYHCWYISQNPCSCGSLEDDADQDSGLNLSHFSPGSLIF